MLCGWWFLKGGCLVISPLNLFQDFCYSQLLFWIDYHYFLWRKLAGKCPPVWGHGPKSHFFWASWLVTFKDVQPFGWVGRSCISAWLLKHLVFYLWFKYSFLLCSANICTSFCILMYTEKLFILGAGGPWLSFGRLHLPYRFALSCIGGVENNRRGVLGERMSWQEGPLETSGLYTNDSWPVLLP